MGQRDINVPHNFGKAIGTLLKHQLELKKVSVTELGELTGIYRTTIHNLLAGKSNNPSMYNILLILKTINFPFERFFKELEKENQNLFE